LTTFMLGIATVSTPMVVILALSDWITLTTAHFKFQQLLFLTLLVELCSHEIDDVPFCDYPLVSTVMPYVDVNTPLVFYSWSK
jgi:hypothetical protein